MARYRVTESVRKQWAWAIAQQSEELAGGVFQDGEPMSELDKAEILADINHLKNLLENQPVGSDLGTARPPGRRA